MIAHPFRAAVEAGDHAAMVEQLAPDVVFHTPVRFRPVEGRDAVAQVLAAVLRVFSDFRYTDELVAEDGTRALLFEATVGDLEAQGIDVLRMNGAGLIADFTVMVRPLSAALALRDAMGRELGLVADSAKSSEVL
jgi:ketosteroid isomerase-like protein